MSGGVTVQYFRDLLQGETLALKTRSGEWRHVADNTTQLSEDVQGDIMVAVGQAELLMKERFAQFSGLIDDCEFKRGEKETTCQDLQGFWDIVSFQVEDIKRKFVRLGELRDNGWKEPQPQPQPQQKKVVKKPLVVAKVKAAPRPGGGGIRAHILAARIKMQNKTNENIPQIKISEDKENTPQKATKEDPRACLSPEKTVFDAGFFKVETPIKTPGRITPGRGTTKATQDDSTTPVKGEARVLASAVLRERNSSPVVHKDYSPCMRITRSMKARGGESRQLHFS